MANAPSTSLNDDERFPCGDSRANTERFHYCLGLVRDGDLLRARPLLISLRNHILEHPQDQPSQSLLKPIDDALALGAAVAANGRLKNQHRERTRFGATLRDLDIFFRDFVHMASTILVQGTLFILLVQKLVTLLRN